VRDDPSLILGAINQILRMEAPIQGFTRYVARDCDLDGVPLPAGSRPIVFYDAASRDPRRLRPTVAPADEVPIKVPYCCYD
jgi:cytochrome P450